MSTADVSAPKLNKAAPHTARRRSAAPSAEEELIQTSFRLPRSRWAKLQQLCIEERQTVQAVIIAALEGEFERRGRKF